MQRSTSGAVLSASVDDARLFRAAVDTPAGPAVVLSTVAGVCALAFDDDAALKRGRRRSSGDVVNADPHHVADAFAAYGNGELAALDAIDVDVVGTPFQLDVWRQVRAIPPGATDSYGALAVALKRVGAERAVGAANGSNPVALIVPCHRVVGKNGQLTGYAFGLERKRALLVHEGALLM